VEVKELAAARLEVGITLGEATEKDVVEGETEDGPRDVPADGTAASASERVKGLKGSGLGLSSVPPLVTESSIGSAITGEYSKSGKENIVTAHCEAIITRSTKKTSSKDVEVLTR